MTGEFAAAVCEGFYGSLEELLSSDVPASARNILLQLQKETATAIEALHQGPPGSTCIASRLAGASTRAE